MKKRIAVIGSGFSGLSAAAYAAQSGNDVHVFEKNSIPGGRAGNFQASGYTFDKGPSWYWMPDVIENFFKDFGYTSSDFFKLVKLDPQFELVTQNLSVKIPESYSDLRAVFESLEPESGKKLDEFMRAAKFKYEIGMGSFVNKPCNHIGEFLSPKIISAAFSLDLFTNFRKYVAKFFKNPVLKTLMEFPVIFLGASPEKIPALYSMMNYGGFVLGTHYPLGGFYELVKAMHSLAEKQGAKFYFNHLVEKIQTNDNYVTSLLVNGKTLEFDAVIASSDYQHTETLLNKTHRNYKEDYWESRTFAPSCLLWYLGFNKKIKGLQHHTLFFENELDGHLRNIYETKTWPEKPLFYACCPSKTDNTVAPENHENLFLLMPLSPGINDEEVLREKYLKEMLNRIEKFTGETDLEKNIDFRRSYCVNDFIEEYNAYKGNAYGLANTLQQTAILKPSLRNKKLRNLVYAGQLTIPGPGVPPSIISGKIAAGEINKKTQTTERSNLKNYLNEKIV